MQIGIIRRLGAATLALALAAGAAIAQTSPQPIPRGGTGASTAAGARTNLGVAIGSDVQAYSANLAALAGLTSANNKCFYWTAAGGAANFDCSAFGRSLANAADASALRTLAGTVIGTDVQAYNANLAALAALATAANKCVYWTGSATAALYDCSSFGRSLANAADASALRTLAGTVIGTDVQAYDADLAALAALTGTGICRRTGTSTWACGTAVANSELAPMANNTIKGNVSGSSAAPSDLTATQVTAMLNNCVGDSGSGGTKGLVPAAGAGDAAAGKFLRADCVFAVPSGGGGGGMSASERQNFALSAIYQAKAFGGYRRMVGMFADGFKASDGINAGASSGYTLDTSGGKVSPSSSTGADQLPTMTAATTSGVTVSADSEYNTTLAAWKAGDKDGATYWQTGTGVSYPTNWKADLGTAATIASYKLQSINDGATSAAMPKNWTLDGSNDNSSWTTVDTRTGETFTAAQQKTYTVTTPGSYRYYRLHVTANNGLSYVLAAEINLLTAGSTSNMVLVTTTQTADATVSSARVTMEIDNSASPALNTDLTAEVTCDGGTTWASDSLSAIGAGQGGREVLETPDQTCGATGTSFAARIKTFNAKIVPVFGLTVQAH